MNLSLALSIAVGLALGYLLIQVVVALVERLFRARPEVVFDPQAAPEQPPPAVP